jgi:Tfp pilus assembly protein PilX
MEVNTMKALKKVIIIVLTALMLVSAFAVPASASTSIVNNTAITANDIKLQIALNVASSANARIEQLVAAAQRQTNPNIPLLIAQTNAISAFAINVINALGFDAECEYVTYEIGGQLVEIDPIIVIPLPGGGGTTK